MRPTSGQYFKLALVLVASLSFYLVFFPQLYMHRIYPLWKAKERLIQGKEDFSLLILGDSRPLAALLPDRFPERAVNLAIEGAATIEPLFLFQQFLAAHPPPKAVIYSVSPIRFMHDEYFWENTVKVRAMGLPALLSTLHQADTLGDFEFTGENSRACRLCATARLLALWAGTPFLYQHNLAYGLFIRGRENEKIESDLVSSRGTLLAPTDPARAALPGREANQARFSPSPLLAQRFDDFLRLAEVNGVETYFAYLPTNPASAPTIAATFNADFRAFLAKREREFPRFHVIGEYHLLGCEYFADQDHVNEQGARLVTDRLVASLSRFPARAVR